MLDSGPLGRIAHPKPKPEILGWLNRLDAAQVRVVIPEIADYEVRRELILSGLSTSIRRLDALKVVHAYVPITSDVMLKAAELWAEARRTGKPTADRGALDCDVILAAQALGTGAVVATENVRHLIRYVNALHWRQIVPV